MRKALLAAAVGVAVLSLAGCGLENIPYLLPPRFLYETTPPDLFFEFENQATTVLEFRGFELYYVFSETPEDVPKGYTTKEQLTQNCFRMYADGAYTTNPPRPLIAVDVADRNTPFEIRLEFTDVEDPLNPPYADYKGANPPGGDHIVPIRRRATDLAGDAKTFERQYLEEDDEDMTGVEWPGSGQPLYLVVYAISYGAQDYYSEAKYLGYIRYTTP